MLILLSEFPSLSILSLMRPMLYFYIYGYASLNIEICQIMQIILRSDYELFLMLGKKLYFVAYVFHMLAYTLFCILMLQPPRSVDLPESCIS